MEQGTDLQLCVRKVNHALDQLGQGIFLNTFSERGRRQSAEVQTFRTAVGASERENDFVHFCEKLLRLVTECIAQSGSSVDIRRENSYTNFYNKRVKGFNDLWNDFFKLLGIPQPDPLWTQTINRLLFNEELVAAIKGDVEKPVGYSTVEIPPLGADEDNVIRYMSGYIPFKLLKKYAKKNTEEAACIVSCLSKLAQSGPEDDFYAYTKEWTAAVNRGKLFLMNDTAFVFFRRLDCLMRGLFLQQVLGGTDTTSEQEFVESLLQDGDLMFYWDILSGHLSTHSSKMLLEEIIELWKTIRGHALAKLFMEQYKTEKHIVTKKSKALRQNLKQ